MPVPISGSQNENPGIRDFRFWHIASFRCDANFGRYRGIAVIDQARTGQARFMNPQPGCHDEREIALWLNLLPAQFSDHAGKKYASALAVALTPRPLRSQIIPSETLSSLPAAAEVSARSVRRVSVTPLVHA